MSEKVSKEHTHNVRKKKGNPPTGTTLRKDVRRRGDGDWGKGYMEAWKEGKLVLAKSLGWWRTSLFFASSRGVGSQRKGRYKGNLSGKGRRWQGFEKTLKYLNWGEVIYRFDAPCLSHSEAPR